MAETGRCIIGELLPLEFTIPKVPDVIDPCTNVCQLPDEPVDPPVVDPPEPDPTMVQILVRHIDKATNQEIAPSELVQIEDGDSVLASYKEIDTYLCVGYEYLEDGNTASSGTDNTYNVTASESVEQEVDFLYEVKIKPGNVIILVDVSVSMASQIVPMGQHLDSYLDQLTDQDLIYVVKFESVYGESCRAEYFNYGHSYTKAEAKQLLTDPTKLTWPGGVEGYHDGQACEALLYALDHTQQTIKSALAITDRAFTPDNKAYSVTKALEAVKEKNIETYSILKAENKASWEAAPIFNAVLDTWQ